MKRNSMPYQKTVFVCLNERDAGTCCTRSGSIKIHAQLKAAIKERGLKTQVRISRSGCMNRCMQGPNVMVFPDNAWYSEVVEADIPTLLDEITKDILVPE
ncbi:MAG: (2Fe-2S) ferredoxin domain-containing protein [Candidatus Hydrogenedentes bacterium]|nr:(2Fe-2S) ferredoxin domain-containing protein [Candidatus Hydrogenedentota bacterium]